VQAAITGALNTQGAADVLATGIQIPLTAGTVATFPVGNALHAYTTLMVICTPNAQPSQLKMGATRGAPSMSTAWPTQTQDLDATPWPLFPSVFLLPCAYQTGDAIGLTMEEPLAARTITFSVIGLTAELTQQVIAPQGMPLDTYQVGGSQLVTANGPGVLLAAPPNGFAYRLHRVSWQFAAANTQAFLKGTASGFTYTWWAAPAANTGVQAENLEGQLVTEGLSLTGAAAQAFLFYDLIPIQTLQ
jgi:hypothetical protein